MFVLFSFLTALDSLSTYLRMNSLTMTLKTSTTWPLTLCTRGRRHRVRSIIPNRFMYRIFTKSHLVSHWLGAVGVRCQHYSPDPES